MALDLNTLLVVTVLSAATAGSLLLLSWSYHRHVPALAFWGCGFLLGAAAAALIAARGNIPDLWSIIVSNALLALAYGVIWSGIRNFEGRRISLPATIAGAAVWLAACQIETFYADIAARVVLMAAIMSCYTALNVYELWHARDPAPAARWPIMILLIVHALAFLIRVPFAESLVPPVAAAHEHGHWRDLIVLETVFNIFCLCYLLGSLARERMVMAYKRDALVDVLTSVVNRRGFLERGERILRRAKSDGKATALLVFDLDRFKLVNDRYGHLIGDMVLKHFCAIATEALRPADLFGRLGGEEFACLLYPSSLRNAAQAGERVRFMVESMPIVLEGQTLRITVSVGVAVGGEDLQALIKAADLALYRAKAKGRNRVEPPAISGLWAGQAAAS
jgi:diguanylate cyclase (GGDEF)-like protein